MVKFERGPSIRGPSSSLGIMRFFDAETKAPKLTPEFVIAISIALIIVVVAAKQFLGP